MTPRVGVSIQARYGSTRLPGKVVMDLAGTPLLMRVWHRLAGCRRADVYVVTTSDNSRPVVSLCKDAGLPYRTADEEDLLARHLRVARDFELDALVRVTGDNPLTDPAGVDELIEQHLATGLGVVHNKHRAGYPFGTGAELVSREVLEELDGRLDSIDDRAAVFGGLLSGSFGFDVLKVAAPTELVRPGYFLTLDYEEDLMLLRAIYEHFDGRDDVRLVDIISFLDQNPELAKMNSHLHEGFAA